MEAPFVGRGRRSWAFFFVGLVSLLAGVLLGWGIQIRPLGGVSSGPAEPRTGLPSPDEALRRANASLEEKVRALEEKLAEKERAWTVFAADWEAAQARAAAEERPAEPPREPPFEPALDPHGFEARFNRALTEEGQREWRLEGSKEVRDGVVFDVALHEVGPHGAISGAVFAAEMRVVFPPVAETLWLDLRRGTRIEGGRRFAIPEEGFRIELSPVQIPRFQRALPELFVGGPQRSPSKIVQALNALLEKDPGGYRFARIGAVRAGELREVEVEQRNSEGETDKRIQAQVARPLLDEKRQTVELILENGTLERKGKKDSLPSAGYRLLFPAVRPSDWKAAGGPGAK